jgi:hypothetical protein
MMRGRIVPCTWCRAGCARGFGPASRALGCLGGLNEGCGDPCVKACDRGNDEALCLLYLCLLEGAVFWVPLDLEFFRKSGSLVVFDAARGASFQYKADACVFAVGVAVSKGLSSGEGFAFEVRLSFVNLSSSGGQKLERDFGWVSRMSLCGVSRETGEYTCYRLLACDLG